MSLNASYQSHPDYNKYPVYEGDDLGLTYTPECSVFRLWSPTATEIHIKIYKDGSSGKAMQEENMRRDVDGTWFFELEGDWDRYFYTFEIKIDEKWLHETPGICAKACGVNGKRAAIINFRKTNPEGWENDSCNPLKNITDSIIYELHVRDFSIHKSSNIKDKGKFLGISEEASKNDYGLSTGLDHLVELGVTHVHLMPIYDFMSIDEETSDTQYNWGYDPDNYNIPEGSYSTKPNSPVSRVKELKQMIFALHQKGIRLVMDVVYNHTGHTESSNFNKVVPGYYYRFNWDGTFSNASGCGNETASERPMVRKYIIDSVLFWAKEYHIDGFRFDLMGIHDIDTINAIRQKLHDFDPSIIVYGEGWTAAESPLPFGDRAVKQNIDRIDGIAMFNDNIRDTIKGAWWNAKEKGFVSGNLWLKENVKQGVVAAVPHSQINYHHLHYDDETWAKEPYKTINYVSCHDNYTFWDKLKFTCPDAPDYELIKMQKLGLGIVLTSQGIPFIHAGSEMLRTKNGVENSYNSPDSINAIDWNRKAKYANVFKYIKGLIQLRRKHPAFRLPDTKAINKHLRFIETSHCCVVAYELSENANGDNWKRIVVVYNGQNAVHEITIREGKWVVVVDASKVNEKGLRTIDGGIISIRPISMLMLVGE